jgi:acyl-CoA reductase-like NAD-dependent aldehyde dehydrogenase
MTTVMSTLSYVPVYDESPALDDLVRLPALEPFGATVVSFVNAFSKSMLAAPEARAYPELAALAFWLRRSSVEKLKRHALDASRIRVPRGVAFHVAPANVDTIFIYSWFLSLLCGNTNIVRVSSKPSEQAHVILEIIGKLFSQREFADVRNRSLIVQYGHDAQVNALFSSHCDVRLVWGGDQTINEIRKTPLPPTAIEMTFANKYSFAVIDAEAVVNSDDARRQSLADAFYNDAYWFAQMACSSPRMIVWMNSDQHIVQQARDLFWAKLQKRIDAGDSGLDMSDFVNKRVAVDSLAMHEQVQVEQNPSNDISRVWLPKPEIHEELHCGGGLFFESSILDLEELLPLLSRKIQTVSYAGISIERWREFLTSNYVAGIDRVVPIGNALDFDYVWDGYDIPKLLLREITLPLK